MKVADQFSTYSIEPIYNTKAVVQRTTVPADTLRAWERRYGVPSPQRTTSGHRSYSERDIALINWLRQQTESGLSISQAVSLLETDTQPTSESTALDTLRSECLEALLAFDQQQADEIINRATMLYPIEHVCIELFQALLYTVGAGWHNRTISVAQEHAVSAYVQVRLGALMHMAQVSSPRGHIMLACAPGEQHDIGLQMVALFLLRRGWKVTYLGSNLPGDDLINTVQTVQPQLLGLSAATAESRAIALVVLRALAQLPNAPVLGYGGYAFSDAASRVEIPGAYLGATALAACEKIEQLLI